MTSLAVQWECKGCKDHLRGQSTAGAQMSDAHRLE